MAANRQFEIEAGIRLSGEQEFRTALSSTGRNLSSLRSELNLVTAECQGQSNSLEALRLRNEILSRVVAGNNSRMDAARSGLENARRTYDNLGEAVENLRTRIVQEENALGDLIQTHGESSDEVREQQRLLENLYVTLQTGESNYRRAEIRIRDWQSRLNNAQAQTINANNALNQNARYMREAEESTDRCANSIDEFGREIRQSGDDAENAANNILTFGDAIRIGMGENLVNTGIDALKSLGAATIGLTTDIDAAVNQLQASTGASHKFMLAYRDSMENIYLGNMGDDFNDIADAAANVVQTMGEIDPSSLEETTNNAILLRNTFGFDYQEQLRSVNMLMDTFGVSSRDAYNLITQGAQNGLNKNDDLLDVINEYSVHYQQMGMTAEDFFNSLKNGTEAGTFSVDKLGDAYKEFGIRTKDTTTTTTEAYQVLGFNADEMRIKFAAGGEVAKSATDEVLTALLGMDDQVQQNLAGVGLFGMMWEDLGAKGIQALTNLNGEISMAHDALGAMASIKYDDINARIATLGRRIQMEVAEPLVRKFLPAAESGLEMVLNNLETVTVATVGLGTAVAANRLFKSETFSNAITGTKATIAAIKAAIVATNGETVAIKLKNLALAAGRALTPGGAIALAIGGIAAAYTAYKTAVEKSNSELAQQKREVDALTESSEELRKSTEENRKTREESTKSIEAEWGACQMMADELYKLADSEDSVNEKKDRMKSLVDQLNSAMPQLNLVLDEQNGILSESKEVVEQNIASLKDYYMVQALEGHVTEILRENYKVESENSKLLEKRASLMKKVVGEQSKLTDAEKEYVEATVKSGEEITRQTGMSIFRFGLESTIKDVNNLTESINANKKVISSTDKDYESAMEQIAELNSSIYESSAANGDMANAAIGSAEQVVGATTEMSEAYIQMKESVSESIRSSISLLSEFNGGTEITAEQMEKNLDSQIKGLSNWSDNMKLLAKQSGKGMTQELYDELIKMGPQGANAVQALVDSLNGETGNFKEICQKWMKAMNLEEPMSEVIAKGSEKLQSGMSDMVATADGKATTVNNSLNKIGGGVTYNALQQSFDGALNKLKESGDYYVMGIDGQFQDALGVARKYGVEIPAELAAGLQSGMISPTQVVEEINRLVKQKQEESLPESKQSGKAASEAQGAGIQEGKGNVLAATADVATGAKATAQSHVPGFNSIGYFSAVGFGNGILSGKSQAINAARSMMQEAVAAAKKAGDIHSPSRKFKNEIGKMIPAGTAEGIKDGTKYVIRSIVGMMSSAQKEADRMRRSVMRKGDFGVDLKNKDGDVKSAAKYSRDILEAATSWLSSYKKQYDTSLKDEVTFWSQMRTQLKKGTAAYREASQSLKAARKSLRESNNDAKKNIQQEKLSASDTALSYFQTYYKVSAKAEVQYWHTVRLQFKKGTQERIEADQKYFEAKESLNSQLKELNEEYVQNTKDVNEKLKEDILDLTNTYKDAVAERKESIYSSVGLFDAFENETESGEKLLYNLRTQVAGIADWELQLQELAGRGLPKGLMQELQEMGPDASASLHALNSLTAEQLREYAALWQQKNNLAESQAVKELEPMRLETEKQIKLLQANAQKELNTLRNEYNKSVRELNTAIPTALKKLAKSTKKTGEDAVAALVNGIKSGAKKKTTTAGLQKATTTISKGLSGLPKAGNTIGNDTLKGILKGLTDEKQMTKAAKQFVENLKKQIQAAAEIHSPSRLFEREVGLQIPAGTAKGIERGVPTAVKAGKDMVNKLVDQTRVKMDESKLALNTYADKLNATTSINMVNSLTQSVPNQEIIVKSDNTNLLATMQDMLTLMGEYLPRVGNMQMVTDTGALIGEISTGVGDALAMGGRRMRR
jgi:phage-related minor tail protein